MNPGGGGRFSTCGCRGENWLPETLQPWLGTNLTLVFLAFARGVSADGDDVIFLCTSSGSPCRRVANAEVFHTTFPFSLEVLRIVPTRKTSVRIRIIRGKVSHCHRTRTKISLSNASPVTCSTSEVDRMAFVIARAILAT